MRTSSILAILSATVPFTSAAVLPSRDAPASELLSPRTVDIDVPESSSQPLTKDTILGPEHIVVYGRGRVEVMEKAHYHKIKARYHGINSESKPYLSKKDAVIETRSPSEADQLTKRDCNTDDIITQNPQESFLGWDVLMSPVIHSTGSSATVAVTEGYNIANSLSVSSTTTFSLVEDFLSTALTIDYTQTWTSTYSTAFTFGVPSGKYGAVVSNPITTRNSGTLASGCVGNPDTITTYQADSFSSKGYSDLNWVDGTISLCVGDTFPLNRCNGDGTL